MKKRLLDWLASYHEATGGRNYAPSGELEQEAFFRTDPRLDIKTTLRFRSKEARDDVVR